MSRVSIIKQKFKSAIGRGTGESMVKISSRSQIPIYILKKNIF